MASTAVYLISLSATVPGLNRCGRLIPPIIGAVLRATFVAGAFLGARPPVDLLAVCLVLRQRQRAETVAARGDSGSSGSSTAIRSDDAFRSDVHRRL